MALTAVDLVAGPARSRVPVHVLRKIAGHGSLITSQRYLHPDSATVAAAGDSLTA